MDSRGLYLYKVKINSVYDGDTVRADVDLGFNTVLKDKRIRLLGIDAPELRGGERERGLETRDYLRSLISNKEVYMVTEKDKSGKYGRYLGTLFLIESDGSLGLNINETLVKEGYAKRYGR